MELRPERGLSLAATMGLALLALPPLRLDTWSDLCAGERGQVMFPGAIKTVEGGLLRLLEFLRNF